MHLTRLIAVIVVVLSVSPTLTGADKQPAKPTPGASVAERCQHGVKKSLCARCNPKLEPVFRAKGDWCEEHKRPESQCAICKPALKKDGIKP